MQVINAVQNNALKGQGSNLMSVPTDCDQVLMGMCTTLNKKGWEEEGGGGVMSLR